MKNAAASTTEITRGAMTRAEPHPLIEPDVTANIKSTRDATDCVLVKIPFHYVPVDAYL